ncbi:protein-glutamine gamma-glutamyltransferase [Metabacillus sp. HB246100]|uniref:protein-glutamine gamma-glutamyltransferase n=1 Tax=Bacillus weihaiensis TaxID=1547283 RepID=UPI0023541E4E|nr:protein-glutamine gamma-glutamyltransferase [Bacillus weihaiensis]
MITIGNKVASGNQLSSQSLSPEQIEMVEKMNRYPNNYVFSSYSHFQFTLMLRQHIIQASRNLLASKVKFRTFRTSYCNGQYWQLTSQGGFKLKPQARPSEAIQDIYENGRLYGFECATAIVIIFYTAVLYSIDHHQFDRLYQGLYLRDWQSDEDLPIYTRRGNDFLPGDCLYFKNPQFDPNTPQWQGENVIDLGNDLYFGHGIGIKTAEGIVESLNKKRSPYATESAHLLSQVTRIDDSYLFQFASGLSRGLHVNFITSKKIAARVGRNYFSL